MKMNRISKRAYNTINSFPRTTRVPQPKQVWLALFPYEQLGNMEKIRPILITKVNEETVECRMITTNPHKATKVKGKLTNGKHFAYFNKDSYVKDKKIEIPKYKLYGMIKNQIELEEE